MSRELAKKPYERQPGDPIRGFIQAHRAMQSVDVIVDMIEEVAEEVGTPLPHAASHAVGGTDPITPASIGAEEAGAANGVAATLAAHEVRTIDVHGIANTATLVTTDDDRLGDARLALPHAGSHATGGPDPITPGSIGATPATLGIATTAPLVGGGDLSADRTLALAPGGITPIFVGGGYRAITAATAITPDDFLIDVTAGTFAQPLPAAAAAGAGRRYILRNSGNGTLTITGPQSAVATPGVGHIEVVSTGTAWVVLSGEYTRNVAGLETWAWNPISGAWRLIGYDSGLRNIATLLSNANQTVNVAQIGRSNRMVEFWLDVTVDTGVAGLANLGALPAGFLPEVSANHDTSITDTLGTTLAAFAIRTTVTGIARTPAPANGLRFRGFWTFRAAAALPTALPGLPITQPV